LQSARSLGVLREKSADGLFRTVVASPRITTAARCGTGFMTTEEGPDGASVVRRDSMGRFLGKLTPGPWDVGPSCSRDGAAWYYFSKSPQPRIVACGTWGCSELLRRQALVLAASPDGERVAFIETSSRDFFVHWIARSDRVVHDLTITENLCRPAWSSNRTLWVARERNNRNLWVEFDVESAKETGRTAPGNTNCSNGVADLKSPVDADLDFDLRQTSQLRVLRMETAEP
jgi:hypothetical protein